MATCKSCKAVCDKKGNFCTNCGSKIYSERFYEKALVRLNEIFFARENYKGVAVRALEHFNEIFTAFKAAASRAKIVAIIAAFALFIIIFAATAPKINARSDELLFYLKDGEIYKASMVKPEPAKITDGLVKDGEDNRSHYIASAIFSNDGENYFYPGKINEGGATYFFDNLKDEKSEPIMIDREISGEIKATKNNNQAFYIKGTDRRFYVYNIKTDNKLKLDTGVERFFISASGDYALYTKTDGTLNEIFVGGKEPQTSKLDRAESILYVSDNAEKIYYLRDETIFFKQRGKEKEKLVSDVISVCSIINGREFYYLKNEGIIDISEYITDSTFEDDASLMPPEIPIAKNYNKRVFKPDDTGLSWNDDLNKWGVWEEAPDSAGFRAAMAEYEKQSLLYEEKIKRDNMREELSLVDSDAAPVNKALYYYNGKESIKISGYVYEVAAYSEDAAIAVYSKYSGLLQRDLSEIDGIYELLSNDDIFVVNKTNSYKVEDDSSEISTYKIGSDGSVYFLDDYSYYDYCGDLKRIKVSRNGSLQIDKIDGSVNEFFEENRRLYYFKNVNNNVGDVYYNGALISRLILIDKVHVGINGDLIYYTDYNEKNEYGALNTFDGRKSVKIADDVHTFAVADSSRIAYISDYNPVAKTGELMLYGKSKTSAALDSGVEAILAPGANIKEAILTTQ